MGRYEPGPIPHNTFDRPCLDFVNSEFTDHLGGGQVYDRLALAEWRTWFVRRWGLPADEPLPPVAHRELADLRALLRRLMESRAEPDDAERARLNLFLSRPTQVRELVRGEDGPALGLRWVSSGWQVVVAAVSASYAEMLVSGEIEQVRVCENPDCLFIFRDESRNRSRRWCDPAICGNLVKVRRHRARIRGGRSV